MDVQDYLTYDGLGLGQLVSEREVSTAELWTAARRRAEAVNPRINAICTWSHDHADARVSEELSGPFAGVPFLLKDLHQHLVGEPMSDGCRALAGRRSDHTSTVVHRWLDAGVVRTASPSTGSPRTGSSPAPCATARPCSTSSSGLTP